ncbi:MAG TPA: putative quinol monooxygenase [Acidimicrobiales bacterium]|nr:putative quinol monooxygenase [Acidimicrobiales bacterium]
MVLLSGFLEYRPEERDEVRAGLAEVGRRSREDPGCVDYWWAEDLDVPGRFRFFECWETEEQFAAHRDQPYEHEFMDRFVNGRITGADAWSYATTGRSPAMGA